MGIEAVALGFTILSAAGSAYQANQQAKAQEKAQNAQSNIADIQRVDALRERIRRARAARAEVQQAGENQGVAGSSGVEGGVASIGSQLAQGEGMQNRIGQQAGIINSANRDIGRAAQLGGIFDAVGSISGTLYNDFRTKERLSVFDTAASSQAQSQGIPY